MRHEQTVQANEEALLPSRYVNAEKLLDSLFDPDCKPSMRWLRDQQSKGAVPFIRIGRLIFFDPPAVKAALDAKSRKARSAT